MDAQSRCSESSVASQVRAYDSSRFTEDVISQQDQPARKFTERWTDELSSFGQSARNSCVEVPLVDALQSLTVIVRHSGNQLKGMTKEKSSPSLFKLSTTATFNSKTFMRVHNRDSISTGCNIHDRYDLEDMLGEGAYGAVWSARERMYGSRQGRRVAVKKLPYGEDIHREVLVLKTVDHPSVARLYEVFDDGLNMYMVLEKCNGGELLDRIMSTRDLFNEDEAKQIMRQITSALVYCHRRNIIHRDIKPENILFCTSDDTTWVKLVDFGLALGSFDDTPRLRTGTEIYSAPELHASMVPQITSKADMWAVGCVLYSMVSGQVPFAGANAYQAIQRGTFSLEMQGGNWDHTSASCKEAIRGLLHADPNERWSAEELMTSSWLSVCPLPTREADAALANHVTHLCSFSDQGLFRRVCLGVVARHMEWTHSGRFVEAFHRLDVDGDGMISRSDWEQVWESVMEDDKDPEVVFASLNLSSSGGIEFSEYLAACVDAQVLAEESVLWSTFSYFGGSPDGLLKFSDLQATIKHAMGADNHVDLVVDGEDFMSMGADTTIEFHDFKLMLLRVSAQDAPSGRCVRWNDDIELRTPSESTEYIPDVLQLLAMRPTPARSSISSRGTSKTITSGSRGGDIRSPMSGRIVGHGMVTDDMHDAEPTVLPICGRGHARESIGLSTMSGRVGERLATTSWARTPPLLSLGLPISSRSDVNIHASEYEGVKPTESTRSDVPLTLSLGLSNVRRGRKHDPPGAATIGFSSLTPRNASPLSLGLPISSRRCTSKARAGDGSEVSTKASSSSAKSDRGLSSSGTIISKDGLSVFSRTAVIPTASIPSEGGAVSDGDGSCHRDTDDDVLSPLRSTRRLPTQILCSGKTFRATRVSGRVGVSSVSLRRICSTESETLLQVNSTENVLPTDDETLLRMLSNHRGTASVHIRESAYFKIASEGESPVSPLSTASPTSPTATSRKTRMVLVPKTPKPDFDYYGKPMEGGIHSPRKEERGLNRECLMSSIPKLEQNSIPDSSP